MHATAARDLGGMDFDDGVRRACARIAPTWPLDQFIAVNPYWGFLEQDIGAVSARLARLSGTRLTMPHEFYREHWRSGALRREHLQRAIDAAGSACDVDELVRGLADEPRPVSRQPLVTDVVDSHRDLRHAMAWRDFVTHQVSQSCAAYFDEEQAQWGPDRRAGLYASWRRQAAGDMSPRLLMGFKRFRKVAVALPEDPRALIDAACRALGITPESAEDYFTALLLSINGWASWCAYLRWQANLAGQTDDHIVELLAIRLAWEWVLQQGEHGRHVDTRWAATWSATAAVARDARQKQERDWLLQAALERAYQESLIGGLSKAAMNSSGAAAPLVQAVFCIDVRSEVFRRALEACGPEVQTRGFAGFFGLPIAYRPAGTSLSRPQLPGLLAPALVVTGATPDDATTADIARHRTQSLEAAQRWREFRSTASSGFSFVESCGLLYAGKLLMNSLPGRNSRRPVDQAGLRKDDPASLRPRLVSLTETAAEPELRTRVDLAERVLRAMGLTQSLARLVLLAGHGSTTANNPHAAGLDCGACGGQTGEVNARTLALLLNDDAVRRGLAERGIELPDTTRFVAGVHDTTTDELRLHDEDLLPPSHQEDVRRLKSWLDEAGTRARAERAASLGLDALRGDAPALKRAIETRSQDWSEVRPEWGLANNAAFIVAPRSRSRHLDLEGRAFLHDYDREQDRDGSTLELIMTAPMVVTNWINMQYYASTVDNRRYGSGNKVLHNVVGGRIGVFEGNGGDLRIGLPLQSLHDGTKWRHTPLRLSVFIEAPQTAIDGVIARHENVRQLVEHGWLHLFQIDSGTGAIARRSNGQWQPADA